jgi:hypothetical protein
VQNNFAGAKWRHHSAFWQEVETASSLISAMQMTTLRMKGGRALFRLPNPDGAMPMVDLLAGRAPTGQPLAGCAREQKAIRN